MTSHEHEWEPIAWLPLAGWKVTAERCLICHKVRTTDERKDNGMD